MAVLPTGGGGGGLAGHCLAAAVGHLDGAGAVGALAHGDFHGARDGDDDLQAGAAVVAVVGAADGGHGGGVVGCHAGDGAVVGHRHAEVDGGALHLLFAGEQCSRLVVHLDAEVLEVGGRHVKCHSQQCQEEQGDGSDFFCHVVSN